MPQPIRIIHLASGDLWAGAEVQLYHLAKALHQRDELRLLVVLLNHGRLETALRKHGIEVQVLDERHHHALSIIRQLFRTVRHFRPDIIHSHRYKENILAAAIKLLRPRLQLVRTVHGAQEILWPWWRLDQRLIHGLNTLTGRHLQGRIIAVSTELAGKLAMSYPASLLTTIVNGVDCEEIHQAAAAPAMLPGEPQANKIAIACRLTAVKRVDIFLAVAQRLLQQPIRQYQFYIFGDGPLLDELKGLAQHLGLSKDIWFMGFTDNIASYLARMDAMLITSDHEGTPLILLEALCLGIPVIAHATGGITALLENRPPHQLCHSNQPDEFCRLIEQLSATSAAPETRDIQDISISRCADQTARVYQQLLKVR
ncbi:MAG: glycosyltransferase [Gammaproteobacteria bacterium]|nr:glycosyltransferase [Gammaproteobacteria bacterium]